MKTEKNILERIVKRRREKVSIARGETPISELISRIEESDSPRGFRRAIASKEKINLICELKKASPSKGVIREDFDPASITRQFEEGGAKAISVLTEPYFFQGRQKYLTMIREKTRLPILRKDFVIDPYQIYESRALGADAVLLIVAILNQKLLSSLNETAKGLMLDCLIEVHDERELKMALSHGADMIGINNRDLRTFTTDIRTTVDLIKKLPDDVVVVSASGIETKEDIRRLREAGVHAFLVGEALMRADDIVSKVKELTSTLDT